MYFEKISYEQYVKAIGGDIDLHKEYNDIKIPVRATIGSAGYDFYSPFSFTLEPNETIVIPTGIRWVCNENEMEKYVLNIYPRSGLGFKYQLGLANTVGIIDGSYCLSDNEGHIMIKLVNRGDKTVTIDKGKGFAQGIITSYYLTENDNVTDIRNGGFGSTNK